jgi:hypothetical protein
MAESKSASVVGLPPTTAPFEWHQDGVKMTCKDYHLVNGAGQRVAPPFGAM